MDRKKEINERLLAIKDEMAALADSETELTEEQDALYALLEEEAAQLEEEKAAILSDEKRAAIRQRAAEAETAAKASNRLTSPNRPGPRLTNQRLAVESDPNRGFKSIAHFVQYALDQGSEGAIRRDEKLAMVAAGTGLGQTVNEYGGVLVPPGFAKTIWEDAMVQSKSLLNYCFNVPVDPGNESITIPAINETSRANGSRWGGIQAYWKSEETQMTETRPKFRQMTLKPQELYCFAYVDDKLLRNAPGAATSVINRALADEIAFKIGDSVVNGDGNGKPIGVIGHAATVSVTKETGQPAATIVRENINKMYNRMHSRWIDGAVWFVNQECIPALEDQKFEVGVAGVPAYLPPGGQSEAPFARLKGKPVIPIEYCAALGTVGDIIFCNLSAYAVAVKGMVSNDVSMHLKFDFNQTAFRMIFEMDGQPMMNSAITPYKGSATYSPIITLATRS